MTKAPIRFNPSRFEGAFTEEFYFNGLVGGSLRRKREQLARILRSKHSDNAKAQALADKLEDCTEDDPCRSGACAVCGRGAQKLLAKLTAAFIAKHKGPGDIVFVSIVPSDGICKPKDLDPAYATRNRRRWREKLGRAGVTWFIGALDYSMNEHDAGRYGTHWCEHIYGVATTTDIAGLKKALRKQFPATDAIPRPVKVKAWDGSSDVFGYLLKPNFWRRVATDDGERANGSRSCRDTDKQRLKSRQRVRLALYLDELGLHGRLFFRWAQFVNRGATASIEMRAPKTVGTKAV